VPLASQDRIELARYAHLPLGNIGGDWMLDVADVHLARCLRDAGHLLWIADPGLPDLANQGCDGGGAEDEDLLLLHGAAPLEVIHRPCPPRAFPALAKHARHATSSTVQGLEAEAPAL
jgi:hypothetical protein